MNKKFFILSLVIIVAIISCLFVFRRNNKLYMSMKDYISEYEDVDDLKKYIRNKNDSTRAGITLILAIENDYDWNKLSLSNNFINKYRDKIIIDEKKIESIEAGNTEINGEDVIVIFVDIKEPMFKSKEYEPITAKYYFKYAIDNDNQLDSIELIKKIYTYSMTGEEIDEKQ